MSKLAVAVLFGGMSNEHEVSLVSAKNVIACLSPEKYTVLPVYITKAGRWLLYDGPLSGLDFVNWEKQGASAVLSPDRYNGGILRVVGDKVRYLRVDAVFPALHGRFGEDGCVQGLCELAGVPYVGSGVLSSALCMDKSYTNLIADGLKVNQAAFVTATAAEDLKTIKKRMGRKIGYPCFVKPARGGSSIGTSKVKAADELERALYAAFEQDGKVVIEKAVVGRELEVAVLTNSNGVAVASRVGEIVSGNEWYDYEAKYEDKGSQTIVSPELPEAVADETRRTAVKLYKAFDCHGLARVDFFYNEEENAVYFNEVNTIPGFTGISMYAMLWKAEGITGEKLADTLIETAILRHNNGR